MRSAVSGVRSSCEASATSRRCAVTDCSSSPSMMLKLVASRVISSSRAGGPVGSSMRWPGVAGGGDPFGGGGEPGDGCQAGAGDPVAECGGQQDARAADRGQGPGGLPYAPVDGVRAQRDLEGLGPAGEVVVNIRTGCPATVSSL